MRISDWSSDVCSSDLAAERSFLRPDAARGSRELAPLQQLLLQLPARRRPAAGAIALGAQGERPDRPPDHHVHERPWLTLRCTRDAAKGWDDVPRGNASPADHRMIGIAHVHTTV